MARTDPTANSIVLELIQRRIQTPETADVSARVFHHPARDQLCVELRRGEGVAGFEIDYRDWATARAMSPQMTVDQVMRRVDAALRRLPARVQPPAQTRDMSGTFAEALQRAQVDVPQRWRDPWFDGRRQGQPRTPYRPPTQEQIRGVRWDEVIVDEAAQLYQDLVAEQSPLRWFKFITEGVAGGRVLVVGRWLGSVGYAVEKAMENGTVKRFAMMELDDTPTGPAPDDQSDVGARGALLEFE